MKLANTFKRVVTTTFIWLAVAIFLAEEWLWDSLAWIMKLFSVFPAIEWLEEKLVSLSPKAIMVVFLVPIIALEPLKVIALTSIAHGKIFHGLTVLFIAKLVGMAIISRIFKLTKDKLLTINLVLKTYNFVMKYRNQIHDYFDAWKEYQSLKLTVKAKIQSIKRNGIFIRTAKLLRHQKVTQILLIAVLLIIFSLFSQFVLVNMRY